MPRHATARTLFASGTAAIFAAVSLTGCGTSSNAQDGAGPAKTLRLGYFANVTHAPAVIGVADGSYARTLGSTELVSTIYNAGPTAVQALLSGSIDAAYVGPGPAINAYVRSGGQAVRVIAGGVSGGAALVVKPTITRIAQLAGKTVADPQRGGTQDIALKYYLSRHGLAFEGSGANVVDVISQNSAQSLTLFEQGRIDAAWLPEPWVSRLQQQAGAKVLVDERTQWRGGNYVTTNLVLWTSYLRKHRQTVSALLRAQIATARAITADPARAARELRTDLGELTGKELPQAVVTAALRNVTVGWDPYASTLQQSAEHAIDVGLLDKNADLTGLYDLRPLNAALRQQNLAAVSDDGLGATGSGS